MKIVKLALITAIVGTLALIILSFYLEPKIQPISGITESDIDSYVKVSGVVDNLKQDPTRFDLIDDSGEILVISFDPIDLSNKDQVEIIGKIDSYYGTLEIVVKELRK